jgi:hypothetical protein
MGDGGMAPVLDVERTNDEDGTPNVEVKVELDGTPTTLDHFADPGVDAPPLPDVDVAAVSDGPGTGRLQAAGYADTKNAGKAEPGERRTVARASDGTVTAEIWSKANGDVEITSLKTGGKIILNGVEIDQEGNIKAPMQITAMAATPATAVTVSQHLVPSPFGLLGPPVPGT